tara:strand:- start:561 stop:698 length:138 start_codon:yes stop_codon:yes gene_type:complete
MITKSKVWKNIVKELREVERSKNFTKNIMKRIKDIPQNENKKETP